MEGADQIYSMFYFQQIIKGNHLVTRFADATAKVNAPKADKAH